MPTLPGARDSGAGAGLQHEDSGSKDGNQASNDYGAENTFASAATDDSKGSGISNDSDRRAAGASTEEDEPLLTTPRKPCCACTCRLCNCEVHSVSANHAEVLQVMRSLRHLTLTEDVVVGGELIQEKSHLLRIGKKWKRRGAWDISNDIIAASKVLLKECVEEEQGVRLTFKCPRKALPWCIPLKFPCCVFLLAIACVGGLCFMGISGSVTIDTNFDSFMDSDSDSSLYYNAFLDAIQSRPDTERRLQATKPDRRDIDRFTDGWWQSFQELASEPVVDVNGHWHPLRFLATAVFGGAHRETGTWVTAPSTDNSSRRLSTKLYKLHQIQFTYVDKHGGSILRNEQLKTIHGIEQKLKQLPQWNELCDEAEPSTMAYCSPGISFVNIVYAKRHKEPPPSKQTILYFNGSGTEPLPMEISVGFGQNQNVLPIMFPSEQAGKGNFQVETLPCKDMDTNCVEYEQQGYCKPFAKFESYMHDFCALTCNFCGPAAVYGVSGSAGSGQEVISSIRSNFRFQAYCCESNDPNKGKGTQRLAKTWNAFIEEVVTIARDNKDGNVTVVYTGDGIEGYEAMSAVMSDLRWAGGSYTFVLMYATLHTRSIFLASVGLFLVMLSIPSALAIFSLTSGSESVSLMSCLSIFIVIGIGSDMLFVYTDFWKQSITHSRDPVKRLKFTYTQAASSTAATTFTTAMSFFANLASTLRPLREFGFFMGACVIMAWLVVFFAYPPMLVLGERCHRRLRSALGGHAKEAAIPRTGERDKSLTRRSITHISKRSSVAMAAMLDPEKKGVGEMHKNFLGERFSDFVRDWKCCLLIVFTIITIGSLGMSVKSMKQASGAPQIFGDDHNQVMGKTYDSQFMNWDDAVANRATRSATECSDFFQDCSQYRCETTGRAMGSPTDCQCYPHGAKTGNCERPRNTRVVFKVIGRQGMPLSTVVAANLSSTIATQFPNAMKISPTRNTENAAECLMQNWDTGRQRLSVMMNPGHVDVKLRGDDPGESGIGDVAECVEQQICYCGIERCVGSGAAVGYGTLKLDLAAAGGRLLGLADAAGERRQLQTEEKEEEIQVKPSEQVDVSIIFGMNIVGTNPMLGKSKDQAWEYQSSFNLQDPWAQRQVERVCKTAKDDKKLKIAKTICWLEGFRDYWIAKGRDWPVRPIYDMDKEVIQYANNFMTSGFQTSTYLWIEDGKVKATYIYFILSVGKGIDASKGIEIMKEWDIYTEDFNTQAEAAIKGIWHASKLWVRSEAEKVIIDSTLNTLAISLGCVFLGIVLFTHSVHLAFLVMIMVMSIIICLLFFMTVMMEWSIGAIEVLSLIVFVGFAVDYCLHVAHKYHSCVINGVNEAPPEEEDEDMPNMTALSESPPRRSSRRPSGSSGGRSSGTKRLSRKSQIVVKIDDKALKNPLLDAKVARISTALLASNRPDERFFRTQYALERMGGAVVGSAFTTVGCAAFLLPCELLVFTKIGSVVMAVTMYAILYTVLPLPALLMWCGPCGNDLQSIVQWVRFKVSGQGGIPAPPVEPDDDRDRNAPRRYVLHMPTRAMGAVGPGVPATRTRVTASG